MRKDIFILLALASLLAFGVGGLLIIRYAHDFTAFEALQRGMAWYWQIILGSAYGVGTAYLGWWIIRSTLLKDVREFYAKLIQPLKLSNLNIVMISLSAGIGEELLFRGGIQPWLGIWPTAIIFVAIHGYLNPKNWRLSLYGVFMTIVIAGLGYAFKNFGLISAMAAHTAIDIVLLKVLSETADEPAKTQEEGLTGGESAV